MATASKGWIRPRYLRAETGPGVRYKDTAGGTVNPQRLVARNTSGDIVEADTDSTDAIGASIGSEIATSGEEVILALNGKVGLETDIPVKRGELLKSYRGGRVGPAVTGALAGTVIKASGGGGFTNQPAGDVVEVLSASASDVTQTVTIYGTTNGTTTVVSETVTLNGTTAVATTKNDWGLILGFEIDYGKPLAAGNITLREQSGGLTIATLSAGSRYAGIALVPAADVRAFNKLCDAVADAATTKTVGLVGTAPDGSQKLTGAVLAGTTAVQFPDAMRTVSKLLVGDLEAARTVTVTVDSNTDAADYVVGVALEDKLASEVVEVSLDTSGKDALDFSLGREILDTEVVIPIGHGIADAGTWTHAITSSGLESLTRTAAAAVESYWIDIPAPSRGTADEGVRPLSVKANYEVDTANANDVRFEVWRVDQGADGAARTATVLFGNSNSHYDSAHDTAAKRGDSTGLPKLHGVTVTAPSTVEAIPAGSSLKLRVLVDGTLNSAVKLTSALLRYSYRV